MQRESKLTNEAERNLTKELANNIGKALEDVSRATGTVAHLYKNLDVGAAAGQGTVNPNSYEGVFKSLVDEAGVVRGGSGGNQDEEMKEEEKSGSSEEPTEVLMDIINHMWVQEDIMKMFTGNLAELGHIPSKFWDCLVQ